MACCSVCVFNLKMNVSDFFDFFFKYSSVVFIVVVYFVIYFYTLIQSKIIRQCSRSVSSAHKTNDYSSWLVIYIVIRLIKYSYFWFFEWNDEKCWINKIFAFSLSLDLSLGDTYTVAVLIWFNSLETTNTTQFMAQDTKCSERERETRRAKNGWSKRLFLVNPW